MKATIKELMKAKEITVTEWIGVCYSSSQDGSTTRSGGHKTAEYKFKYDSHKEKLFVFGDVFGNDKFEVKNGFEVLFNFAHGYAGKIKIEGLEFEIHNATIDF